jgi:hypothetical protein
MGGFEALLRSTRAAQTRKPPGTVTLKPSAWASSWAEAPTTAVQIGLRRLAEEDILAAKGEAARITAEAVAGDASEEDRISIFNDTLMRVAVARGACSTEDASVAFFQLGELAIRQRMTPEGVRAIWDALQSLHVSDSPLLPELDNEGFAHLIAMWDRGVAFEYLPANEAAQVLRLLEHVRQTLETAESLAERDGKAAVSG